MVDRSGGAGGGGDLLPQHPPPALSGDGGRCRSRSRGGGAAAGSRTISTASLQLIDEGFDGRELLRQVTQMSLEGVELLVEVVQSLRQRLDPEGESPQRIQPDFTVDDTVKKSSHGVFERSSRFPSLEYIIHDT